jgi:hypothetical protein
MTARSTVLLFMFSVLVHADTLILRNGDRVNGRWWATDGNVISFVVNDRLERYPRSEVLEVQFSDDR